MMSKIHPKLKPFVIDENTVFSSMEEVRKKYEQLEDVCSELDKKHYIKLPEGYTYTASDFIFPAKVDVVVPFHRGRDDVPNIPAFLMEDEDLLEEMYGGVIIEGEPCSKNHPDVCFAVDTERYIFIDNAYRLITGGYAENRESLVEMDGGYAFEGDIITTYDTQEKELRQNVYEWTDGQEVRYYRYPEVAPDAPHAPIRFDEADFPAAQDINETRIGIELEYADAVEASRAMLLNPKRRRYWNSVRDGSIPEDGTEFVSIPLRKRELSEVTDTINFIKKNGGIINTKRCGFHVHIGSPEMDFMGLTSIVVLCQNIENDLFKLVPEHRQNNRYCRRLDETFNGFKKAKSNSDVQKIADAFYADAGTNYERRPQQNKWAVGSKRHFWLSIDRFFRFRNQEHRRTVEFRMYPATHKAEEFMQFILLCYYIVEYALSVGKKRARNSDLNDIINYIPNRSDREKVESLLQDKMIMENA